MSNHDSYFHLKKKIKKIPCGQPPFPSCCPALLCAVFAAIQLLPGLDRKTCSRSEVSGLAWLHSALSYWLKMGLRVRNTYTFPCLVLPPPPPRMAVMCSLLQHCCLGSLGSRWVLASPHHDLHGAFPSPSTPWTSHAPSMSAALLHTPSLHAPHCWVLYPALLLMSSMELLLLAVTVLHILQFGILSQPSPTSPTPPPTTPSCNNFVDTIRLIGLPALTWQFSKYSRLGCVRRWSLKAVLSVTLEWQHFAFSFYCFLLMWLTQGFNLESEVWAEEVRWNRGTSAKCNH